MNIELLGDVVNDRLERALDHSIGEEEQRVIFKEAMEAVDKQIQIDKLESTKKVDKKNQILKIVEIAAVPAALMMADAVFKTIYMKKVCNFEKDYTFTTTAGKGIAGLFRLK